MTKLLHLTYWFLVMLSVPDLTSIWNLADAVISIVGTGCRLYEVYGAFLEQHKMWFCLSTRSEFYPSDLYESHSQLRSLFGHYLAWSESLKTGKNLANTTRQSCCTEWIWLSWSSLQFMFVCLNGRLTVGRKVGFPSLGILPHIWDYQIW